MNELTPEEQACFDAGLRRAYEIRGEIDAALASDMPSWALGARMLDLHLEMEELTRKLEAIAPLGPAPLAAPELPHIDIAKFRQNIEFLREQREPTPAEIELIDFAERLAMRQGTVLPDFVAFYQQRMELERRITDRAD